jgi:hypothetical protein
VRAKVPSVSRGGSRPTVPWDSSVSKVHPLIPLVMVISQWSPLEIVIIK